MPQLQQELNQAKRDIANTMKTLGKSQALSKPEVDALHKTMNRIITLITILADTKLDKKK